MNQIISLEQVHLKFHRVEVFFNVNFSLPEKSFYFLTGPSGSGKTSLLKMLYGALLPSTGIVSVLGKSMRALNKSDIPAFRRNLGLVFQDEQLIKHFTPLQNVALPLIIREVNEKEALTKANEMLEWVGLTGFTDTPTHLLSAGQRQRVAIARAVIANPKLILADEPTANVDRENALRMLHLFEELYKSGVTVVVASHDRSLAAAFPYPEIAIRDKAVEIIQPGRRRNTGIDALDELDHSSRAVLSSKGEIHL